MTENRRFLTVFDFLKLNLFNFFWFKTVPKSAPACENFSLETKAPCQYFQGILFVHDFNKKSDVFLPFLLLNKQKKPKKIIFFDDKRKNVEGLEILKDYDIEYICVYYRAIEIAPPIYNREIAAVQYKLLDQKLSNEEALLLKSKMLYVD